MQVSRTKSGLCSSSALLHEAVGARLAGMQRQHEQPSMTAEQLMLHCDGYEGALGSLVQDIASTMKAVSTDIEMQLGADVRRCDCIIS